MEIIKKVGYKSKEEVIATKVAIRRRTKLIIPKVILPKNKNY